MPKVESRKPNMAKLWFAAWAALTILVVSAARAEVIDRVLAMVGSQVVTLSDVRAAEAFALVPASARTDAPSDVLRQWVNRQLMLGEVERYSAPDPDRAVVDRRLAEIRAAFPGDAEYARTLARTAMSDERLRALVTDNARIESYVEQRFGAAAQPTPDEVQRYYREHPMEFTTGGRLAAFEEVQLEVQARASGERKRILIADWLDRLRRRGGVSTR
jgi:hypothetical protein